MEATFSYFPYSYFSDPIQDLISTTNLEPTCMAPNDRSSCSSMAAMCSPMLHHESPAHAKKRNMAISSQGSTTASASLTSPQHKDGTAGSKRKKQKRSSSITEEDKKKKAGGHGGVKGKEACGEPPAGYIHVRARRGHATDSHSLAERVRREKISERMRMLQSLVPGCDKVTGKALMLNEIINYVQSLQIQVEFLSMKLASMNPMSYEFGVLNIDSYPRFPELARVAHMPHELLQTTTEQQPSFDGATSTATMDYQVAMSTEAAPHLSVLSDPTAFAQILQGGSSPMVQVVGQGQCNLHDKVEYFNTMYSFQ